MNGKCKTNNVEECLAIPDNQLSHNDNNNLTKIEQIDNQHVQQYIDSIGCLLLRINQDI